MIKVLIIVLSELSSGELTIGYEFGGRLSKNKFAVEFLVPEKFTSYLQDRKEKFYELDINNGAVKNKVLLHKYITRMNPDFIIISDVYTMEFSRIWSGINMEFIKKYNVPIIGIDEYEYLSTNCTPDYYGGIYEQLPKLLEYCDYIIRDCPINTLRIGNKENVKCFSLYGHDFELDSKEKKEIRKELGINNNEKMIFFATSAWENINFHKTPALGMFLKWMPFIIQNYLNDLDQNIVFIHIGPNIWENNFCNKIRYKNYSNLEPKKFDNYLLSADLFITTNVVSVTLSKAVFGKIPSIVFQNHKLIDFSRFTKVLDKRPKWYQEMAEELKCIYPFRAGFFGWYRLLEPVLNDNPYTETFLEVQLFKYSEVLEKLRTYLFNQTQIIELKKKQNKYMNRILMLDTPNKIMDCFINMEKRR